MLKSVILKLHQNLSTNQNMTEEKKPRERRRSIIRDFSLNTSTHGIPGIARSPTRPMRIFWIITTLAFATIMVVMIALSFLEFLSYPTQTSVSMTAQRTQTFPAFSICNYSPLRHDLFIDAFIDYVHSKNKTISNATTAITPDLLPLLFDFFREQWDSDTTVSRFFFSLESIMLSCQYNNMLCNASNFTRFLSIGYGACYSFNVEYINEDRPIRQTTDGVGFGQLTLELYAHSHLYVPLLSNIGATIVGMVHDNSDMPLIDIAGLEFGAGHKHKVSYKRRTYEQLRPPYSDCTDIISPEMSTMFRLFPQNKYRYSQIACFLLCTQRYVYDRCGCVDPAQWTARYIYSPDSDNVTTAKLCNRNNTCYAKAKSDLLADISLWNSYCSKCKEPCSSTDFTITTSLSGKPSSLKIHNLKGKIESLGVPMPEDWSTNWTTHIAENYVFLEVISETTRAEVYQKTRAMSEYDLIANIGGHTGLWIGISFLSLMEVIEMIYRIIYSTCQDIYERKKRQAEANERF